MKKGTNGKIRVVPLLIVIGLVTVSIPMFSHHGTGIAYEDEPIVVEGTVKQFDWLNPHARLFLEVKDAEGNVQPYVVEMNSPGVMIRQGWNRRQFEPGDEIQITVYPSRAGTPAGSCIGTCKVIINGVNSTPGVEIREGL